METKERERYRVKCLNFQLDGTCLLKSGKNIGKSTSIHYSITCSPDSDCRRLRQYDIMQKQK